ncbi:STAS domain-containing protein [Streptomyces sp. NPDC046909]|uniref:GAF domain-containing protein n=1 Tax=Streptomyces sp. NPDC046909 TaxID=3155617 RepID=UPI0033C8442B
MAWSQPSHRVRMAVTHTGDVTTIHVAGELDVASLPVLARALRRVQRASGRIALDLSRVTACGPGTAELLVDWSLRLGSDGGELAVHRAHSCVLRMLRSYGRLESLQIASSALQLRPDEYRRRCSLLREALVLTLRLTGAPMGNAQLLEPGAGVLHIVTQRGFHQPFLSFFETVDDRDTACGVAAQDRSPVFVDEVPASPIFLGTPALDVLHDAKVGSVASLPVSCGDGTLIGVVSVHRHEPAAWTSEQRRTLTRLARAAGQVL